MYKEDTSTLSLSSKERERAREREPEAGRQSRGWAEFPFISWSSISQPTSRHYRSTLVPASTLLILRAVDSFSMNTMPPPLLLLHPQPPPPPPPPEEHIIFNMKTENQRAATPPLPSILPLFLLHSARILGYALGFYPVNATSWFFQSFVFFVKKKSSVRYLVIHVF